MKKQIVFGAFMIGLAILVGAAVAILVGAFGGFGVVCGAFLSAMALGFATTPMEAYQ